MKLACKRQHGGAGIEMLPRSNHEEENWHRGLPNTPPIPIFIKFNNATVSNHPRTKYSNEILFEVRNIIEI